MPVRPPSKAASTLCSTTDRPTSERDPGAISGCSGEQETTVEDHQRPAFGWDESQLKGTCAMMIDILLI